MSAPSAAEQQAPSGSLIDASLLTLRIGLGVSLLILLLLKPSGALDIFPGASGRAWPLVLLSVATFAVVLGVRTEWAAAFLVAAWIWAGYSELRAGAAWFAAPVRAAEYIFLYTALGLAGPGKYSIDALRKNRSDVTPP